MASSALLCWHAPPPPPTSTSGSHFHLHHLHYFLYLRLYLEELGLVVKVDRLVDDLGKPELVDVQSRDVSVVEDERVAELMV